MSSVVKTVFFMSMFIPREVNNIINLGRDHSNMYKNTFISQILNILHTLVSVLSKYKKHPCISITLTISPKKTLCLMFMPINIWHWWRNKNLTNKQGMTIVLPCHHFKESKKKTTTRKERMTRFNVDDVKYVAKEIIAISHPRTRKILLLLRICCFSRDSLCVGMTIHTVSMAVVYPREYRFFPDT